MEYFIDGYNLIFSLVDVKENLQILREKVIATLRKKFAQKKISATVVFDGKHRREEESGLSYPSPLIVAYAPKGQSADAYIVEQIARAHHPKQITVVTNDQGLARHVKAYGAKVLCNDEFLDWLNKRKKKSSKIQPAESQKNIERLLKIFEERFENREDD